MARRQSAHSFLFADLVGFTAFSAARGDVAAADLAVAFATSIRALAGEHCAEFVKAMGDSVMVRASTADEILRLGLRVLDNPAAPAASLPVRIGIHSGPAVGRDGDWYGTTVNIASRLADRARGGELLLTASTGERLGVHVARGLVDRGLLSLRNVPAPVRVFAMPVRAIDRAAPIPALVAA